MQLAVFDVLGRRVATLVDGVQPAGDHTATWRADGFPSGVYVVTLQAGSATQTQRIVLMK